MNEPDPVRQHDDVQLTNARPLRADARRNAETIITTARGVFSELGPEAPLDVIARRAGVGPGTLYRRFPTREHLIEAVYGPDIDELTRTAADHVKASPQAEALERWIRNYFIPAQEERGVAAMLKNALTTAPEVFSSRKERFAEATSELLRAAQTSGAVRADVTARDILRMTHGIVTVSADALEARGRMLDVMFEGLRHTAPRPQQS